MSHRIESRTAGDSVITREKGNTTDDPPFIVCDDGWKKTTAANYFFLCVCECVAKLIAFSLYFTLAGALTLSGYMVAFYFISHCRTAAGGAVQLKPSIPLTLFPLFL